MPTSATCTRFRTRLKLLVLLLVIPAFGLVLQGESGTMPKWQRELKTTAQQFISHLNTFG